MGTVESAKCEARRWNTYPPQALSRLLQQTRGVSGVVVELIYPCWHRYSLSKEDH